MSSISFEIQKGHPEGFVIVRGDKDLEFLMPRLISVKNHPKYQDNGISPEHCLYILAMDIIYKFQCEDLDLQFDETREFISTYFRIYSMKKNPWFKSDLEKLALKSKSEFMKKFFYTLEMDLDRYYGEVSKKLVRECKKEMSKLKPWIF